MQCKACQEKKPTRDGLCDECHQAMWDGLDALEKLPAWLTPDEIETLGSADASSIKSPIQKIGEDFYFWDMTWTKLHGPYGDYDMVVQAIRDHVNSQG